MLIVDDIIAADTAAGTAALHLVTVLDRSCTKGSNEFFHPDGVLGIQHHFIFKLALLVGFCKVTAVVDSDACTSQRVGNAVANLIGTDVLFVVQQFCDMVDIDRPLVLHIDLFEHLIDPVTEILVVLELVVDFPDRLVTAIAEEGDIHLHLLGKHKVPGRHCIPYIEIDRPKGTRGGTAACTLQGQEIDTQFLTGLDCCRFTAGIPVRGNASEIECELEICV
jgi:hypothetical protein